MEKGFSFGPEKKAESAAPGLDQVAAWVKTQSEKISLKAENNNTPQIDDVETVETPEWISTKGIEEALEKIGWRNVA